MLYCKSDVTHILSQIESGGPSPAHQLLPLVYDELRKLAAARMAQEAPGHTLQTTGLVHEVYLRLVDVKQAQQWDSRGHFFPLQQKPCAGFSSNRPGVKSRSKPEVKTNVLSCLRSNGLSTVQQLIFWLWMKHSSQVVHVNQGKCSERQIVTAQQVDKHRDQVFVLFATDVGRNLDSNVDAEWLWKGRRVYMFDGSTVSMPDTQENQREYPQVYNQKPGLGFPIARIAAIISLSCGAILSMGICRYAGKRTGGSQLAATHVGLVSCGDGLLTDCVLSAWVDLVMLKQRGVDSVTWLNKATRKADFRRGKRLGKNDHIVQWPKPTKPRSIASETYRSLPDYLTVREIRV